MRDAERLADRAAALHDRGLERFDAGDVRGARSTLTRSLRLMHRACGARHPDVANVLVALSRLERESGNAAAAARHGQRAARIMARVRGGGDLPRLRVQALTVLAEARCAGGDYGDARALLQRALSTASRQLGRNDIDTAVALNALGIVYKYLGQYEAAARAYQRVRRTLRDGSANPHDLATFFHNVAGLEHARGRFARAELLARRALRLRRSVLPPGHPQIAAEMAALAPIVGARGRHAEADRLLRVAIVTFRRVHGPSSYDVAVALHNLAGSREAAGDLAAAERLYRHALRIKTHVLGQSHPDTGITSYSLGLVRAGRGGRAEAQRLLKQGLSAVSKRAGPRHPVATAARTALRQLRQGHE